jgi:hypothetical protein
VEYEGSMPEENLSHKDVPKSGLRDVNVNFGV